MAPSGHATLRVGHSIAQGLNSTGSTVSLVERLTEARLEDEADSDEAAAEGEAEEGHDLWGVGLTL
jgi:hypothetical protein